MRPALLAIAGLVFAAGAQAQLVKCVAADGQVTYTDRGCPSSHAASAIKAPPIAEPTRRDALAAQYRRIDDNYRAAIADIDRRAAEARPAPGPVSLGGEGHRDRGMEPRRAPDPDSARCAGIRHQQRRAKIRDPMGFDRTIHWHELQRAEQRHCDH